jgi:hypothetical protein
MDEESIGREVCCGKLLYEIIGADFSVGFRRGNKRDEAQHRAGVVDGIKPYYVAECVSPVGRGAWPEQGGRWFKTVSITMSHYAANANVRRFLLFVPDRDICSEIWLIVRDCAEMGLGQIVGGPRAAISLSARVCQVSKA